MTNRNPVIVCAANRHMDLIITGARHFDDIMYATIARIFTDDMHRREACSNMEQGFIDQFGTFYNRQDAMKLVLENGQPFDAERNSGNGKDLYSEGLY